MNFCTWFHADLYRSEYISFWIRALDTVGRQADRRTSIESGTSKAKTKISQQHVLHTVMDTNVTKEKKTTLSQMHSDRVWKVWLFEIRGNSYWQTRTCTVSMHEVFVYTWVSVTKLYDSRLINSIEVILVDAEGLSSAPSFLTTYSNAAGQINAQQFWPTDVMNHRCDQVDGNLCQGCKCVNHKHWARDSSELTQIQQTNRHTSI